MLDPSCTKWSTDAEKQLPILVSPLTLNEEPILLKLRRDKEEPNSTWLMTDNAEPNRTKDLFEIVLP
jgi:hypothetical protein